MKLADTPENRATVEILTGSSHLVDWWRNPAGKTQLRSGGWLRYGLGGLLGTSDWIGIVRATGRSFFLEVKAKGKKPDLLDLDRRIRSGSYCPDDCEHLKCHLVHQELVLRRARAAGAIGIFADCIGDVLKALEAAK